MHAILIWAHVCSMMVAFGASPLGRLGMRYILLEAPDPQSAKAIARRFSNIFLVGGISVTIGVSFGVVLAWSIGLTQMWIIASIVLIVTAGITSAVIEDRWLKKLCRAEHNAFAVIASEKTPLIAAMLSPVLWLTILWLMIEKPF